jgi:hypothetical protein
MEALHSNRENTIDTNVNDPSVDELLKKGKGKNDGKVNGTKDKRNPASGINNAPLENEYKKGLRPILWLTPDFPLKTEELLPLLDILANKVKAVRRLRELLTTKLPPGTFPVKVRVIKIRDLCHFVTWKSPWWRTIKLNYRIVKVFNFFEPFVTSEAYVSA